MAKLLGVIAGGITLFFVIVLLQMIGTVLHPVEAGADPADSRAVARWLSSAPFGVQLMIATAWFFGALGSGWVAQRLSDWRWAAWIIAGASTGLALISTGHLGQPGWMQVLIVLGPLVAGGVITYLLRAAAQSDLDPRHADDTINI